MFWKALVIREWLNGNSAVTNMQLYVVIRKESLPLFPLHTETRTTLCAATMSCSITYCWNERDTDSKSEKTHTNTRLVKNASCPGMITLENWNCSHFGVFVSPLKSFSNLSVHFTFFLGSGTTHLFNGIQWGSYWNDRHENYSCSIIVVVLCAPQSNTEELEDVKRIQDLMEEERETDWKHKRESIIIIMLLLC